MALFYRTIIIIFLIVFFSLNALHAYSQATNNLAFGKFYTLSLKPNYSLTALATDTTSLTDGKYTFGRFWTQKTTVGWQNAKSVNVLIDLGKNSNIGSIAFNTARGEKDAEVYYPAHIAAFVGSDREHFLYVGDLAIDPKNQPGSYQVRKFVLSGIEKRARYVFLEIIPKGQYLFCDEIEITEGGAGNEIKGSLSIDQALAFADKIRQTGIGGILNKQLYALNKIETVAGEERHAQKTKSQVLLFGARNSFETTEDKMFSFRNNTLKAQFPNRNILIQSVAPWDHLIPSVFQDQAKSLDFSFLIPKGGYDSKALSVSNLSSKPLSFSVSLDSLSTGVELTAYQVPFVKTSALEYIADPLAPIEKGFTLRPGESRILFVTAHAKRVGRFRRILTLKSKYGITSIPIETQVANIIIPEKKSLNSVNWGYLDFELIKDRHDTAVNDLLKHHTNVIVVPPNYLPIVDSVRPQDFSSLTKYLRILNGASRVLLFVDFGSTQRSNLNGRYPFMSNKWQKWFKVWYENLKKACVDSGISVSDLYLYPYDEMNGKKISDFIVFASWVRKEIPEIKLYATINDKNALIALPYLDIAQIVNNVVILRSIDRPKTELWLYDGRGPAKLLSPYSYYRLMAWTAFLNNYKGIGFWAYADSTRVVWYNFDEEKRDYGVIYQGEGTSIISSRRWEAWRMGIEDYELLTMYSKAKGDAAAKRLAKSVLDNPLDTTKADEVRKKILLELSK